MKSSGAAAIERVLIYRLGSLGDTVVVMPALHLVARTFPNARRIMLTNVPVHAKAPAASAIIGDSGLVDGYMSYPVGTRSARTLLQLWLQIRRFRPQVLIYLTKPRGELAVKRDARFFRLCGIRRIIGLPLGDLAEPIYFPDSDIWEHESARLLRTIRVLGSPDSQDLSYWDLRLTGAEKDKARQLLSPIAGRPFIACGPGTKMQAKDWGEENWRQLLARLGAALPDYALVLVGAKEDAQVSDYAAADWHGPVVNLCGQVTPRETAAALDGAELFLGPDSGPMHLAAAQGVPCAIAFASRDRKGYWFPIGGGHQVVYHTMECSLCKLEVCIEQKKKCLTSIGVDEMLQAALQAMKHKVNVSSQT
ncbi:MAG TPA: glycosyltransferase family 9 protein [Silvibacterium sp.]|nr:glycosyltransferase family 9 protein [Silvibacterium sp.]